MEYLAPAGKDMLRETMGEACALRRCSKWPTWNSGAGAVDVFLAVAEAVEKAAFDEENKQFNLLILPAGSIVVWVNKPGPSAQDPLIE